MNLREKEFERLSTRSDEEVWTYLLTNKPHWCTVWLDADDTFIMLDGIYDDEDGAIWFSLKDYIGWSEGVVTLLRAAGIQYDHV